MRLDKLKMKIYFSSLYLSNYKHYYNILLRPLCQMILGINFLGRVFCTCQIRLKRIKRIYWEHIKHMVSSLVSLTLILNKSKNSIIELLTCIIKIKRIIIRIRSGGKFIYNNLNFILINEREVWSR